MFARGWTPLDEDVHFPPAWFAKISKLRTVGSEMPHTTWGKDGWITFNYDVMQFISDANPSYGTDIVFLVCPCTVPRGPLMWATIYQGRKMFQRTSEQGGMPADVVELLKMSPYRPNLIVMDGRIYIWLRVNYMPLPQRFSELSAGKRSDSVDEGTASQARPRYGDCRPDAVGWPRLSGHRHGDWSNSVLKCAPKRQAREHRDANERIRARTLEIPRLTSFISSNGIPTAIHSSSTVHSQYVVAKPQHNQAPPHEKSPQHHFLGFKGLIAALADIYLHFKGLLFVNPPYIDGDIPPLILRILADSNPSKRR